MKRVLICGAAGFIGGHLVKKLKREGHFVCGVDLKRHEFTELPCDEFILGDLRDVSVAREVMKNGFDEVYQLAADMGGAGYIFTGEHDADIMSNSVLCNLNVLQMVKEYAVKKIFYSSSACIYPGSIQGDPRNPGLAESMAYPAMPDSDYGWEKLFSERLYLAFLRNYGVQVRIARFHNIFGPFGSWDNGKEKFPAAICRKVAEAAEGGCVEIWGDGEQTRSFLYIDECLEGISRLMESDFTGPVNIGSSELISINAAALMAADIAGKKIKLKHIPGPVGVRGRCSDNRLILEKLGWCPRSSFRSGMEKTYPWILEEVKKKQNAAKLQE